MFNSKKSLFITLRMKAKCTYISGYRRHVDILHSTKTKLP